MRLTAQVSLRELLLLIFVTGAGLAALRTGGILAGAILSCAMLLTMGLAIVALVRRDRMQAFAIGFVVPVTLYLVLLWGMGASEFDPYAGRLPTTTLLLPVQQVMTQTKWIDMSTGQEVLAYDPPNDPDRTKNGIFFLGTSGMGVKEYPDRTTFMAVAHILLAMLLGYVGGKFGAAVWQRPSDEAEGQR